MDAKTWSETRGPRRYEVVPYRDPFGMASVFRWTVYRDLQRIGSARNRKEALELIDMDGLADLTGQQLAAIKAQDEAEAAGLELLDVLRLNGLAQLLRGRKQLKYDKPQ